MLHLNLYRKYFDAILKGDKVVEYRDITPYWSKRLEGRHYDIIQFRNGYAKVASSSANLLRFCCKKLNAFGLIVLVKT